MALTLPADPLATEGREPELAALDYSHYPYIPRKWVWPGHVPTGTPVIYAAAGGTGKGMLFAAVAARVALGLPFPGEDQGLRRAPGRVVWISGPGEDDQFEDLAPRLRAAIAVAVEAYGLDPALAGEGGAIRLVHDLSAWPNDDPVTLPGDCARVLAEIKRVNAVSGGPPVALVVADSLSAVLSQGYTIDSRQGAVRVMVKLGRFARRADVALAVLHHVTKGGKVAGSAGVLNSVRLAFVIERDPVDESVRVVKPHKSNTGEGAGARYLIAGDGPMAHAAFIDATDARAERLQAAQDAAEPGSLRARVAAAAPAGGPYRVMRRVLAPGSGTPETGYVGPPCATREAARDAACADAGRALDWSAAAVPGMDAAALARADGTRVTYGVYLPAEKPASAGT